MPETTVRLHELVKGLIRDGISIETIVIALYQQAEVLTMHNIYLQAYLERTKE